MKACQFCGFLSDPLTGNIFDPAFPCPKCGKRAAIPGLAGHGQPTLTNFSAAPTLGANIVSTAKIAGLGACFFYLHSKLSHIPSTDERLGPIKKASYFIPALALPYVVELVTKEEWPILGTLFQVGVGGMAIKTALQIDTSGVTRAARSKLGLKRKH
jgi:hypothetical protein